MCKKKKKKKKKKKQKKSVKNLDKVISARCFHSDHSKVNRYFFLVSFLPLKNPFQTKEVIWKGDFNCKVAWISCKKTTIKEFWNNIVNGRNYFFFLINCLFFFFLHLLFVPSEILPDTTGQFLINQKAQILKKISPFLSFFSF